MYTNIRILNNLTKIIIISEGLRVDHRTTDLDQVVTDGLFKLVLKVLFRIDFTNIFDVHLF